MEQKEFIYVQRSWTTRSGKRVLLAGLALIGSAVLSATAIAQENPVRPLKTICGAEENGNVFTVLEFETRDALGVGSHTDKLPQTVTAQEFPFQNYRLFSFREKRFRVATQISEHAYAPGQYFAYLALYEELGDSLILRSGTTLGTDALRSGFRLFYEIPQSKRKVTCLVHAQENQSNRAGKKTNRQPAKVSPPQKKN